jgi:FkbM family methyltransferase
MKNFKQKIETVNALRKVYNKALIKLLFLYIIRKPIIVNVNPIGINIRINDRATSVMLARAIYKLIKSGKTQQVLTVQHNKLCLKLGNNLGSECFSIDSLGKNLKEVLILYSTIQLIINTKILSVNNETFLVKTADGILWYVRRRSLDDISAPLLPLISEPYEYRWFEKIVKENSIFVDVGAFLGGYTIRAAKKGAKVIAFEASKSNYLILEKNIMINNLRDKVTIFNLAIGSTKEKKPLFCDNLFYATFSLMPGLKIVEEVDVLPLDEVIMNTSEKKITLLKIDVEGVEVDVLKGASQTLKYTKYVMIEVNKRNMKEVYSIMKLHGFKVLDINPRGEILNIFFGKCDGAF